MRRIAILWLLLFFCLTACGHINGYFKQSPKILQDCAINLITMNVPLRIKMLENKNNCDFGTFVTSARKSKNSPIDPADADVLQ